MNKARDKRASEKAEALIKILLADVIDADSSRCALEIASTILGQLVASLLAPESHEKFFAQWQKNMREHLRLNAKLDEHSPADFGQAGSA